MPVSIAYLLAHLEHSKEKGIEDGYILAILGGSDASGHPVAFLPLCWLLLYHNGSLNKKTNVQIHLGRFKLVGIAHI